MTGSSSVVADMRAGEEWRADVGRVGDVGAWGVTLGAGAAAAVVVTSSVSTCAVVDAICVKSLLALTAPV